MAHSKKAAAPRSKPMGIRAGDQVVVLSGSAKGAEPRKVISTLPREGKVLVEGVNVMKDRQRKDGQNAQEVVEKPFPIHRSKVALFDPKSKKPTRIKNVVGADGKRTRVSVRSGDAI